MYIYTISEAFNFVSWKFTSSSTKHVKYGTKGCSPESVAKLTSASLNRTELGMLITSSVIFVKYNCSNKMKFQNDKKEYTYIHTHTHIHIPEVLWIRHVLQAI